MYEQIDPIYLPFTRDQLLVCLPDSSPEYLDYYMESASRFQAHKKSTVNAAEAMRPEALKLASKLEKHNRQIEKDERFWSATCLMSFQYRNPSAQNNWASLMRKAFGDKPPASFELKTWEECFDGKLHLVFEESLPSPEKYKIWIKNNLGNSSDESAREKIPH